jgi:antitoxin PrlF
MGACTNELHTHPHPACGCRQAAAAGEAQEGRFDWGKDHQMQFAKSEGKHMPIATVTSKGQITIPKSIRLHLKLVAGEQVRFIIESSGRVVLMPAAIDASELRGLLAPAPRRLSIEQMDVAIRRRTLARNRSTSIR